MINSRLAGKRSHSGQGCGQSGRCQQLRVYSREGQWSFGFEKAVRCMGSGVRDVERRENGSLRRFRCLRQ